MKHLRYWSLTALAVALILLPTRACGPDFPSAVFVLTDAPDGDYARFAAGHLGVLQPGFHSRSLALAYRILTGPPLTPAEQQQAVAANKHFVSPDNGYTDGKPDPPPPGFDAWIKARDRFGPVDGFSPDGSLPNGITIDYEAIPNCLDPAFTTAASTLAARMQQHGPKDPTVTEWVRGQDVVFSNCSDGKSQAFVPPGQPPAPPAPPQLPATLPNAPLWLQQDRAYQIAAAQFYATDFDDAAASFHAIAQDTASPWSTTARYVEARVLIRKAAFVPQPQYDGSGTPLTEEQHRAREAVYQQQLDQATHQREADLQQAQQILLADSRDPRMADLRPAIGSLLDYLNARLDPNAQTVTLAQRVLSPGNPHLDQTLIDFTALHTNGAFGEVSLSLPPTPQQFAARQALIKRLGGDPKTRAAADMTAWIDDLNGPDTTGAPQPPARNPADALARWRATPTTPWLVAAILFAQPNDADAPALIAAAKKIAPSDPAWLTVTYHRLRLTPHDPTTRAELLTLLPQIKRTEGPSAVNLFTALLAPTAPTLADWLPTTPRTPAAETYGNDDGPDGYPQPKEDVCGRPLTHPLQLFDTDAAVAFNRQLPLRILADAAASRALPENLRYQVAQAALVRAILLDQPAIAQHVAPVLESCRAAWKPVLDAYAAAHTSTDRHAAGLFVLMRFASAEPSVREGEERRNGFASYDDMRQNWWCSTVPLPTETVDNEPVAWRPNANPDAVRGSDPAWMTTHPHTVPPPPAFLTAADLAQANSEVAALNAVPNASTYFARQALDWFHDHPKDPRTPELLGQADRVLRNSCRRYNFDDNKKPSETAVLAHQLFDALHQHFPNSPWTKRYKTWE